MDLTTLTLTVQQLIAESHTDEALMHIVRFAKANNNNEMLDRALLLQSRYTKLLLDRGLMLPDSYQVDMNNLEADLLNMLRAMHTQQQLGGSTNGVPKQGRLLHNIPPKMSLKKESKCIVRIAYSDQILTADLPDNSKHEIVSVRIAGVMGVELIDPSESPKFTIRAINDEDQMLVSDDYTQWMFYIKPLEAGPHALLLKVAVVEIVNNIERRRDVVLEKEITVVAQAPEMTLSVKEDKAMAALLPAFVEPTAGAEPESPAEETVPPRTVPPSTKPRIETAQSRPAPTRQPKKRALAALLKPFVAVASVAAAAALVVLVVLPNMKNNAPEDPSFVKIDTAGQQVIPNNESLPELPQQEFTVEANKPVTPPDEITDPSQGKATKPAPVRPKPITKPRPTSQDPVTQPPPGPVNPGGKTDKPGIKKEVILITDGKPDTIHKSGQQDNGSLPPPLETDKSVTAVVLQLGSQHSAYQLYADGVLFQPTGADYLKYYYKLPAKSTPTRIKIMAGKESCDYTLILKNNMLIKACDVKE